MKHGENALIDLVDGLSSGSVVLVSMTNGDLADHDAHLGGRAIEHLLDHDDHAQAIVATLRVIVGVFLGGDDQTLSCRMIDKGGLQ